MILGRMRSHDRSFRRSDIIPRAHSGTRGIWRADSPTELGGTESGIFCIFLVWLGAIAIDEKISHGREGDLG